MIVETDARAATLSDQEAIDAMREAYFFPHPIPERDPACRWYVALENGEVVGCWSEEDIIAPDGVSHRHVQDFYRVPGLPGTRSTKTMHRAIVSRANADQIKLISAVDPENAEQIEHEILRGFRPVALLLVKDPEV